MGGPGVTPTARLKLPTNVVYSLRDSKITLIFAPPFEERREREMRGTGLHAVTTYPTISRQDKVSDFYFNCLCGTGHLLEGVQRPHVSDGQRRW